jgi:hypothetical protein
MSTVRLGVIMNGLVRNYLFTPFSTKLITGWKS